MHKLTTYRTTIKDAGSRVTVGECSCGWRYEGTFVYEVKQKHRKHVQGAPERPTINERGTG